MHNLHTDALTGETAMFLAGHAAWHALGQNVSEAQTWQDAQRLAHLDFELVDAPLYTNWSASGLIKVATHKAIVRKDTKQHVGIVGMTFQTVQPTESFQFVDTLVESGAAHYVSAGLLGNSQRMWVLIAVPGADISVGDDKSTTYLLFAQGFDGSMALISKLTSTRVVCQNTLQVALNDGNFAFKIKHTKSAVARLEAAKKLLSGVAQNAQTLEAKLRTLAARRLTRDSMVSILDRVFPKNADAEANQTRRDNVLADVLALYETNDRNAFPEQRGTAYNLLNAITNYTDHSRSAKANGADVATKRAESALFGTGAALKANALQVIEQLTDGSERIKVTFSTSSAPVAGGSLLDAICDAQPVTA